MVDDPKLRSELAEVTVSPSASDPGYMVETHGPDDRADAAVVAVTESMIRERPPSRMFNSLTGVRSVPSHQEESLRVLYGSDIPEYAIDR